MRDYWLTQYLLAAVGWTYIVVCLVAIALALWLPKTKRSKAVSGAIVLALASILPIQGFQEYRVAKTAADDYKVRLAKAQALFDERCKTAGEKIYKTVDNVEGVLLIKVRPEAINFSNQYAMDDPYGRDVGGEGYIASFVSATSGLHLDPKITASYKSGYGWVEVADTVSGTFKKYTGSIKVFTPYNTNFQLENTTIPKSKARFGVTYEDISTHQDREFWIAGGSVKIVDLATNETIAERIGFMMDRGQGSTGGQRSPWAFARDNSCPSFRLTPDGRAIRDYIASPFTQKILKPFQGD